MNHNTNTMPIIIVRQNVRKLFSHLQVWTIHSQAGSTTATFGKN
jgi:hypothetical protein